MLILSRGEDEEVLIVAPNGEKFSVRVTEMRGKSVRLGFDFPKDYLILRAELARNEAPQL